MKMFVFLAPLPLGETLTPQQRSSLLLWLAILLVVVVLGGAVLLLIRRRITEQDAPKSEDVGFSLSDLRAMRDRGEITSEEYERTRARVVAGVKRMVGESPKQPREERKWDPPGDVGGNALGDTGNTE